jgi:hypothetical protein
MHMAGVKPAESWKPGSRWASEHGIGYQFQQTNLKAPAEQIR